MYQYNVNGNLLRASLLNLIGWKEKISRCKSTFRLISPWMLRQNIQRFVWNGWDRSYEDTEVTVQLCQQWPLKLNHYGDFKQPTRVNQSHCIRIMKLPGQSAFCIDVLWALTACSYWKVVLGMAVYIVFSIMDPRRAHTSRFLSVFFGILELSLLIQLKDVFYLSKLPSGYPYMRKPEVDWHVFQCKRFLLPLKGEGWYLPFILSTCLGFTVPL